MTSLRKKKRQASWYLDPSAVEVEHFPTAWSLGLAMVRSVDVGRVEEACRDRGGFGAESSMQAMCRKVTREVLAREQECGSAFHAPEITLDRSRTAEGRGSLEAEAPASALGTG